MPRAARASPPRTRTRHSGEVRRQQIAEAALRIIARRGLNRLTAVELAREVGIADGTIFRHFRDKTEIVRWAVDALRQLLARDFPPPAHLAPLERLERFVQSRLQMAESDGNLCALAFSDRLREAAGPEGLAPLEELTRSTFRFVETCLREAQAEGSIDPSLPLQPAAVLVMGALHSPAALRTLGCPDGVDSSLAVWATLRGLLCRGASPDPVPLSGG